MPAKKVNRSFPLNISSLSLALVFALPLALVLSGCDDKPEGNWDVPVLSKAWSVDGFAQPESVIYDLKDEVLYVSNVAGNPNDKDGKGFISKIRPTGEMIEEMWVEGLNAPKGMAIFDRTLYVADINTLVVIDLADKSVRRFEAIDAIFLNDVAVDANGRVYVSDMMDNVIYRLDGENFSTWIKSGVLDNPNGLFAEEDRIVIGAWGPISEGFNTTRPGNLKTASMDGQTLADLGSGAPIGNLDGVEGDGFGNYFVTDWMNGKLLFVRADGSFEELLDLNQGSADLAYIPSQGLIVIPMMNDGKIVAYKVE
ncbi:MAG: hypothetical protein HOL06_10900 [Rhodospirillaceae bacterium]|nr:hypothetical protein [Rhodospirillaceae bacterium]